MNKVLRQIQKIAPFQKVMPIAGRFAHRIPKNASFQKFMPIAGRFARQIPKNASFQKVMTVTGSFVDYYFHATWANVFRWGCRGRKALPNLPATGITSPKSPKTRIWWPDLPATGITPRKK